jgi:hypothetical protein
VQDDCDDQTKQSDDSVVIGSSLAQALLDDCKIRKVHSAEAGLESMIRLKDQLPVVDPVTSAASELGAPPTSVPVGVPTKGEANTDYLNINASLPHNVGSIVESP